MKRTHVDTLDTAGVHAARKRPRAILYTDALHCIFARVCSADLHLVGRVSRQWRCALSTVCARTMHLANVTNETVAHMVRSPFRRHVVSLGRPLTQAFLSSASLQLIRLAMPHVTKLQITVEPQCTLVALPHELRELTLGCCARINDAALRHLATDAPHMTRVYAGELTVELARQLERLACLTDVSAIGSPTFDALDVVRRMTTLERLGFQEWPLGGLTHLMRGSEFSRLRYLIIGEKSAPFCDACAAALEHVTTLRGLHCRSGVTASTQSLTRLFGALHRLEDLTLLFANTNATPTPREIVSTLPSSLKALEIGHAALDDASLCALGEHVGRSLTRLYVREAPRLITLHCVDGMKRLERLEFHACPRIRPIELRRLRQLRELRRLVLHGSAADMDDLTRATLTPGDPDFPSRDWPHLHAVVFE
jgi:hypothetical protein